VYLLQLKLVRKTQKEKIAYNTYVGSQEASRTLPTLNATEYALLLNESYANSGSTIPYPNVSNLGKGTNWQDETLSTGVPILIKI
jgi:hypothetical protein